VLERLFDSDIFRTITSRSALAGIAAFLSCLALGPYVIRWLKSRRVGENVEKGESERLDRLMSGKKHTPTMGGVFVCAAVLFAIALFGNFKSKTLPIFAFVIVGLGAIGAIDDALKLTGRRKAGLSMFWKLVGQVLVGQAAGIWLLLVFLRTDAGYATQVFLPWGGAVDIGVIYPSFVMLVLVACSNAVNITDGLDGLAAGCLAISIFAYAAIA